MDLIDSTYDFDTRTFGEHSPDPYSRTCELLSSGRYGFILLYIPKKPTGADPTPLRIYRNVGTASSPSAGTELELITEGEPAVGQFLPDFGPDNGFSTARVLLHPDEEGNLFVVDQVGWGLAGSVEVYQEIARSILASSGSIEAQRIANAGGTADAISATFVPPVTSLSNGLTVYVRAAAANTVSGVVFQADGTAAKPVVKGSNKALEIGDIAGAGHWLELQFDSALDKWVLQNPALSTVVSIGVRQTWQDVTASRTLGTNYTNTTGRSIAVSIRNNMYPNQIYIFVDGILVAWAGSGTPSTTGIASHFVIVPPGSVYKVQSDSGIIISWLELR